MVDSSSESIGESSLPPVWGGTSLPSIFGPELIDAVNPGAVGLIHALQFATRYSIVGRGKTGDEVVLDKRAFLCGTIEDGLKVLGAHRSSFWLAQWLAERSDPDANLRRQDHSDQVARAISNKAELVLSVSMRRLIPAASKLAELTVGRERIDLRHLLIALIDDANGHHAFSFIEPIAPSPAEVAELKARIVDYVVAGPEPGEKVSEWRALAGPQAQETLVEKRPETGSRSAGRKPSRRSPPKADAGKERPGRADATVYDDRIPTQTDNPASKDLLGRNTFAEVIARRIQQLQVEAGRQGSDRRAFMIHVHGRWGSGKSSFLHFLKDHLEKDDGAARASRVVWFNAWEHALRRPPWWAFLSRVYLGLLKDQPAGKPLAREAARRIRRHWWGWRLRSEWLPILAIIVFSALGVAAWGFDSAVKVAAVVIAAGAGIFAAARWMIFGSRASAEAYSRLTDNPIAPVVDLFNAIAGELEKHDRPLVVLIDDLDRCDADYLVELLEGIQNFFKGSPVTYVAAADRDWICNAFEKRYGDFAPRVGEPARPLGYLFLDKLFQISAGMPHLTDPTMERYFKSLTGNEGAQVRITADDRAEASRQVGDLKTEAEIQKAVKDAEGGPTGLLLAVREAAALQMTTPKLEEETEHRLKFLLPLMEPNPRSIKLLLNEVGTAQSRGFLEGRSVAAEASGRWAILSLRWPLIADFLAENPARVAIWTAKEKKFVADLPEGLAPLAGSALLEATIGKEGDRGALDEEVLRQIIH